MNPDPNHRQTVIRILAAEGRPPFILPMSGSLSWSITLAGAFRPAQVWTISPCKGPARRLHGGAGLDGRRDVVRRNGTAQTTRVVRRAVGA